MTVQFVGAGPGAADLLTVRATRLLANAEVVLYPGTYLDPGVLAHCSPDAELVDTQGLDLERITAILVEASRSGRSVVRRNTSTGRPSAGASSCTPPLSVSTRSALSISLTNPI